MTFSFPPGFARRTFNYASYGFSSGVPCFLRASLRQDDRVWLSHGGQPAIAAYILDEVVLACIVHEGSSIDRAASHLLQAGSHKLPDGLPPLPAAGPDQKVVDLWSGAGPNQMWCLEDAPGPPGTFFVRNLFGGAGRYLSVSADPSHT